MILYFHAVLEISGHHMALTIDATLRVVITIRLTDALAVHHMVVTLSIAVLHMCASNRSGLSPLPMGKAVQLLQCLQ